MSRRHALATISPSACTTRPRVRRRSSAAAALWQASHEAAAGWWREAAIADQLALPVDVPPAVRADDRRPARRVASRPGTRCSPPSIAGASGPPPRSQARPTTSSPSSRRSRGDENRRRRRCRCGEVAPRSAEPSMPSFSRSISTTRATSRRSPRSTRRRRGSPAATTRSKSNAGWQARSSRR